MPRTPSVTYVDFERWASRVEAEGKILTARGAREHFEAGSLTTFQGYLERYKGWAQSSMAAWADLPEPIADAAKRLAGSIHHMVRRDVTERCERRIEEYERTSAAVNRENVELSRRVDDLETNLSHGEAQRVGLEQQLRSAETEIAVLKASLAATSAERDRALERADEAGQKVGGLAARVELLETAASAKQGSSGSNRS